jgi:ribulose-5-phosphate 4-epimerase/fuculose-1-phosphate aldolase
MSEPKQLLDGYVGVKYSPVCTDQVLPPGCAALFGLFKRCGDRLREHGMTPANGGNMSRRIGEAGFVITTSGCNLGLMEPDELALVQACSLDEQRVTYAGPHEPSSEALLHWLVYQDFLSATSVLHAHDPAATATSLAGQLPETPREEPYGTVALARLAAKTFAAGSPIIVLKNHGYVAHGRDLEAATEIVVEMHLTLMESGPDSGR